MVQSFNWHITRERSFQGLTWRSQQQGHSSGFDNPTYVLQDGERPFVGRQDSARCQHILEHVTREIEQRGQRSISDVHLGLDAQMLKPNLDGWHLDAHAVDAFFDVQQELFCVMLASRQGIVQEVLAHALLFQQFLHGCPLDGLLGLNRWGCRWVVPNPGAPMALCKPASIICWRWCHRRMIFLLNTNLHHLAIL